MRTRTHRHTLSFLCVSCDDPFATYKWLSIYAFSACLQTIYLLKDYTRLAAHTRHTKLGWWEIYWSESNQIRLVYMASFIKRPKKERINNKKNCNRIGKLHVTWFRLSYTANGLGHHRKCKRKLTMCTSWWKKSKNCLNSFTMVRWIEKSAKE